MVIYLINRCRALTFCHILVVEPMVSSSPVLMFMILSLFMECHNIFHRMRPNEIIMMSMAIFLMNSARETKLVCTFRWAFEVVNEFYLSDILNQGFHLQYINGLKNENS